MTLETMQHAIDRLQNDGYDEDFRATDVGLEAIRAHRIFAPEELSVDEIVRFEGMSDPDDEAILFAVRTLDGVKGTYTVPFGAAMTIRDSEMVRQLRACANGT
jgi:hypothetical protein